MHSSRSGFFESNFQIVSVSDLEYGVDVHGIAFHEEKLLLASTGIDQILSFDPATSRIEVLWAAHSSLCDNLHLNDLTISNGDVICSSFGPKIANAMRAGEVFSTKTGQIFAKHMREPHSPTIYQGELFVLESAVGDLLHFKPGFEPKRICGVTGYARGLVVTKTHYIIGKSGYRTDSKSTIGDSRVPPLAHSNKAAEMHYGSGIYFVDRKDFSFEYVDTAIIENKIYNIAKIPEAFFENGPISYSCA